MADNIFQDSCDRMNAVCEKAQEMGFVIDCGEGTPPELSLDGSLDSSPDEGDKEDESEDESEDEDESPKKTSDGFYRLLSPAQSRVMESLFARAFDEDKHPRHGAGDERGGEFAPKDGADSNTETPEQARERRRIGDRLDSIQELERKGVSNEDATRIVDGEERERAQAESKREKSDGPQKTTTKRARGTAKPKPIRDYRQYVKDAVNAEFAKEKEKLQANGLLVQNASKIDQERWTIANHTGFLTLAAETKARAEKYLEKELAKAPIKPNQGEIVVNARSAELDDKYMSIHYINTRRREKAIRQFKADIAESDESTKKHSVDLANAQRRLEQAQADAAPVMSETEAQSLLELTQQDIIDNQGYLDMLMGNSDWRTNKSMNDASSIMFVREFDESKHVRHEKGDEHGGQFAPKDEAGAERHTPIRGQKEIGFPDDRRLQFTGVKRGRDAGAVRDRNPLEGRMGSKAQPPSVDEKRSVTLTPLQHWSGRPATAGESYPYTQIMDLRERLPAGFSVFENTITLPDGEHHLMPRDPVARLQMIQESLRQFGHDPSTVKAEDGRDKEAATEVQSKERLQQAVDRLKPHDVQDILRQTKEYGDVHADAMAVDYANFASRVDDKNDGGQGLSDEKVREIKDKRDVWSHISRFGTKDLDHVEVPELTEEELEDTNLEAQIDMEDSKATVKNTISNGGAGIQTWSELTNDAQESIHRNWNREMAMDDHFQTKMEEDARNSISLVKVVVDRSYILVDDHKEKFDLTTVVFAKDIADLEDWSTNASEKERKDFQEGQQQIVNDMITNQQATPGRYTQKEIDTENVILDTMKRLNGDEYTHKTVTEQALRAYHNNEEWARELIDGMINQEVDWRIGGGSWADHYMLKKWRELDAEGSMKWAIDQGLVHVTPEEERLRDVDYANLVGAPEGATVTVNGGYDDVPSVSVVGDGLTMTRTLHPNDGYIYNHGFFMDKDSPYKGTGAEILAQQVLHAQDAGYQKLKTGSARSSSMVGYYAWYALGYDTEIDAMTNPTRDKIKAKYPMAKSMLDVFEIPGGKDWWLINGDNSHAEFDLTPGSRSMKVLTHALKMRNKK